MMKFKKKLSQTDVTKRLAFPTRCFKGFLPLLQGKHFVDLEVMYKSQTMKFRCSKRKKGKYLKPVLTKGWLDFVRREKLKAGDMIVLREEKNEAAGAEFKIEIIMKSIRLFGKDICID
ncbi:conserved hypothetical protein [Ricinus communis]|uniref:TF-B3 domain-containing protein n=1 Tax=Ricinus communis TaxID=3988 RepID=B9SXG4_RICCO|nr:conserved hypothetical protein [Ricinus communis]